MAILLRELLDLEAATRDELSITVLASTRIIFEGGLPRLRPKNSNRQQALDIARFRKAGLKNLRIKRLRTYLAKCQEVARSKQEVVVKVDDDIFMSTENWERFLSHIKTSTFVTEDVIVPILTTGIPSCEIFLTDWLPAEISRSFREVLAAVEIPESAWGVDYSKLKGTYKAATQEEFFSGLATIDHHYKGMHPIRFSNIAQANLVQYVLNHRLWTVTPKFDDLVEFTTGPYFCNNLFACRQEFYFEVVSGIKSGVFFNDGFDEVAVNQLLDKRGRRMKFARGVLGIHPSYNTVESAGEITAEFFDAINEMRQISK